jgi:hypothetical protein
MHEFGRPFRVDRCSETPRATRLSHRLRHDCHPTFGMGIFIFLFSAAMCADVALVCFVIFRDADSYWVAEGRISRLTRVGAAMVQRQCPRVVVRFIQLDTSADAVVRNAWQYRRCRYEMGCSTKSLEGCGASRLCPPMKPDCNKGAPASHVCLAWLGMCGWTWSGLESSIAHICFRPWDYLAFAKRRFAQRWPGGDACMRTSVRGHVAAGDRCCESRRVAARSLGEACKDGRKGPRIMSQTIATLQDCARQTVFQDAGCCSLAGRSADWIGLPSMPDDESSSE